MRIKLTIVTIFMASVLAMAQNEKVLFSSNGGFYKDSFELSLDCLYANHHIRYTTNGATPTANSRLYRKPLYLDERLYSASSIYKIQVTLEDEMYYPDQIERCIVIRAAVFDENDQCISPTVTNTYFIASLGNDSHGLPLVSICADSLDLFDYERGIFVPGIHFNPDDSLWTGNYFQSGKEWERTANIEFYELDNSGINQLAGLRTHGMAGRRYQQKNLAVFAREEYGKKRFKHPFFESLNIDSFKHLQLKPFSCAWSGAGVQDALCQAIANQSVNVESLATRPAILFLNGEYWGIYYMRCWREGNGKWRWIFYDADACLDWPSFDVFENATHHGEAILHTSSQSTVLFRRLLANETFRDQFFDRFQELIHSHFQFTETHPLLLQLENKLNDEIHSQANRFGMPVDYQDWTKQCEKLETILRQRPEKISKELDEFKKTQSWHYGEWLCYPNPFSETLTISFHTDRSETTFINIYDTSGRCVYSSQKEIHSGTNAITLNLNLSPGLYLLTLGKIRQYLISL